jgi:hypothetical protein
MTESEVQTQPRLATAAAPPVGQSTAGLTQARSRAASGAVRRERDDARQLFTRCTVAEHRVSHHDVAAEIELPSDLAGDRLVIARDHLDVDPHRTGGSDRLLAIVRRRVEQRQQAKITPALATVAGDPQSAIALAGVFLDEGSDGAALAARTY